jgi:hypothetical protein
MANNKVINLQYKIEAEKLDKIIIGLRNAYYLISASGGLDWEHRLYAETQIADALDELRELKRPVEEFAFSTL